MSRRPLPPRWHDEQLVEALVPTPLPVAPPQPAPMPTLPPPADQTSGGVLFDVARPDSAGRVTARPLLRALGWTPGLALRVDVVHAALLIAPAVDGEHVVGAREELPLPAAARHLCGITPGQPVLLAAFRGRDLIVVHPSNTITTLLADLHAHILGALDER
ncbi:MULTISPECIES: hypothetical protein [unclassified Micromonospora]|uniref:hypothetical protein n=1 Tax=unclassified Micromonospora TaxID=2617518 RepID=UPI001C5D0BF0|nr:hypothetical protein [Micromonospora sp. RL09-050-HVF-A]MBW4702055.1 hypothetical protein [Micromonospora sp. RL09-050-HVF-A]